MAWRGDNTFQTKTQDIWPQWGGMFQIGNVSENTKDDVTGYAGLNLPPLVHVPPLHAPQILIQNHQTITLTMQGS